MSGALDATLVPLAYELINEFGKPIAWTSRVPGSYDPNTSMTYMANTSYSVVALVEDVTDGGARTGKAFTDGTRTTERAFDVKVSIAAQGLAVAPASGDFLTIDGAAFTIGEVKAVMSGASAALYECKAIRG